jgi:amidase
MTDVRQTASEPITWSAVQLSDAIRDRQVSCREVMTAFLDHIDACNPAINAIVSLQDRESLLAQADERDRALARGEWQGWMHGMPSAIKDLSATAGIPTTLGSPIFRDQVPDTDAIFVERIRASGAIIIGKTNTPEFGLGSQTYNSVFGATRNPYDTRLTAGGSSGGAAAALAMRMLPVADGSDMMGSLRNPGAFNNIVGFRPSVGRIPSGPAPELFLQQLASDGAMGRSVDDVAMLLSVQSGHDLRAPLSLAQDAAPLGDLRKLKRNPKGLRLGWLGDLGGRLPIEAGIADLCGEALHRFEDLGCVVEDIALGFDPERLWRTWLTLRHWLVSGSLGPLYDDPRMRDLLKPEARWEVEGGLNLSAREVYRASVARSDWYRTLLGLFGRVDFLLLPSAQVFPFDVDIHWPERIDGIAMQTYHQWMEVVVPGSLSGCPIANVPVGFNADGLPMGMQIIGPPLGDLAVLQLAQAYEEATDWVRLHPPPMLGLG